jgi:hypothetical protein
MTVGELISSKPDSRSGAHTGSDDQGAPLPNRLLLPYLRVGRRSEDREPDVGLDVLGRVLRAR